MPNLQYEYTDHNDQMDPVATADTCGACFEMDEDLPHAKTCWINKPEPTGLTVTEVDADHFDAALGDMAADWNN